MALNSTSAITALENRVTKLEKQVDAIQNDVSSIKENTDLVVDVLTATKTVSGFLRKHGPRMVAFGTGIATTLGIGNPSVWKFIANFTW